MLFPLQYYEFDRAGPVPPRRGPRRRPAAALAAIVAAALLAGVGSARAGDLAAREAAYGVLADLAADAVGLDRRLVRAVIRVESAWRPEAVSPAGAVGLFQMLPSTASDYAPGLDLSDPADNVAVGVVHLRRLVDRFGVVRALAAWNAGEGALSRRPVFRAYGETRRFVAAVLREIERLGGAPPPAAVSP